MIRHESMTNTKIKEHKISIALKMSVKYLTGGLKPMEDDCTPNPVNYLHAVLLCMGNFALYVVC